MNGGSHLVIIPGPPEQRASKVVGFTERLVLRIRWRLTGGLGFTEPLLHMEHVGALVKESGPLQLYDVCVERANSQRSMDIT